METYPIPPRVPGGGDMWIPMGWRRTAEGWWRWNVHAHPAGALAATFSAGLHLPEIAIERSSNLARC